ncbi:hypothetical protein ACJJTC_001838 [Scirpophaga incertulas]
MLTLCANGHDRCIHPRDWGVLKNCWENLKKRAKQCQTSRNQHFLGTGGGPPKKIIEDPAIDRVLELIQTRITGFTNSYDSDGTLVLEDNSNKSGAGTDDIYHSKWFAYKSQHFLQNKNLPTATTDTDTPSTSHDSQRDSQSNQNDLPQMSPENTTLQQNKRPKINPNKELISEALNIMKNVSQRPNWTKDEDGLFGDCIAGQLRQMDRQMKAIVRHRINNIIFEAETGYRSDTFTDFARPSSVSSSHSHPGYYTESSLQQTVVSPSTNNLTSSEYSAQTNPDPQTIIELLND